MTRKDNRATRRSIRRSRQRGFTLVEMIVATILLAVGVVASMAAIGMAARSTASANDNTTVSLLAQRRFSEVESQLDQLSGGDQSGDFGDDYPGYRWQQTTEPTDYTGLMRVTVTIQWGNGPAQRSRDFITYENVPQSTTTDGTSTGTGTGTGSGAGTGNPMGGL